MKVKVCGITTYEDAAAALDSGADALGFNFYARSPRYVDPATARSIIRRLPPFAVAVGLFVNVESPGRLVKTARAASVHVLQLHGDESPQYCARLGEWTVIKALRVGAPGALEHVDAYSVQSFVLDAADPELYGGTGRTFDWTLARRIKTLRPLVLAGGLTAQNVRAAIEAVEPYGVDVCSGVESAPGKKDPVKLKEFLNEVRKFTAGRSGEPRT